MGAFVGFAVSFGGSAISQAITNNGNIDWAVAAVDGVFGALSGALATTGIGIAVSAFIDAGLTLANEAIVVGMQNNWQYSNEDWMRIGINSGISALTSFALDLKCIGLTNSAQFKAAKSAIKTFKSKVARNAYKHGQKSIDTAAKYVNKLILKSFTTKDAFISYSSTLLLSFI